MLVLRWLTIILYSLLSTAMREITGDARYETVLERTRRSIPFSLVFKDALLRPVLMLIFEPIVLMFSLYMTFVLYASALCLNVLLTHRPTLPIPRSI